MKYVRLMLFLLITSLAVMLAGYSTNQGPMDYLMFGLCTLGLVAVIGYVFYSVYLKRSEGAREQEECMAEVRGDLPVTDRHDGRR